MQDRAKKEENGFTDELTKASMNTMTPAQDTEERFEEKEGRTHSTEGEE